MAQKKQITRKTLVLTAVIGSFLIMVLVVANTLLAAKKTGAATEDAVSAVSAFYLEAMADRRAKIITNLIDDSFDRMERAVTFIEEEEVRTQEQLRNTIGKAKALLMLNRFALVDEDDVVYTQYTTYTGRTRHSFLAEKSIDGRIVTTVSIYGSSKQLCLVIPTPGLTVLGKPMKACFVQLAISEIVDLLAFDDHGRTYYALYSKSGTNLSGTELGTVISTNNLFDTLKGIISEEDWEENYRNFANEKEGRLSFVSGESEETLCYVPIEGTGWEMAVFIQDSVIQEQIRGISESNVKISRNQMIIIFAAVLVFGAVLLFQFRKLSKERLEKEKENSKAFQNMANTDSMTGVKNKHAYSEAEMKLNEQIQAGELEKLAVVIGDINGLKFVNDTQGHAAGDQLIKDACAMICDTFKHGAVFRIGGDEFVILLQGKGFDTMPEVIRAFNQKVEENIKEDAVVVSLGFSTLSQEDRLLHDVFERADQMMYERKKELKAMGAKTRPS